MSHRSLVVLALAACSGSSSYGPNPPPPPPPPPPSPVTNATVEVRNDVFSAETITLRAGGTVTWTWVGQDHNVTSVLSPTFLSSATRNAPFTHGPLTFATPGTYRYICTNHGTLNPSTGQTSGMRGTIVVVP